MAKSRNWLTETARVVEVWAPPEPVHFNRTKYWEAVVKYSYPGFHGEPEFGEHYERFYDEGISQLWAQRFLASPNLQVRVEPREGKASAWEESERVEAERPDVGVVRLVEPCSAVD